MVGILGIHSSPKLERALHEDVGFRVLSGNQQPDHWTPSEFRRRHHKELGDLFEQTVQAAVRAGLVKLNHVAVDGTKVKANASKHRAMSHGRMKEEERRLREDVERWLEESEATDRAEDEPCLHPGLQRPGRRGRRDPHHPGGRPDQPGG
jgi:hypothetical protein